MIINIATNQEDYNNTLLDLIVKESVRLGYLGTHRTAIIQDNGNVRCTFWDEEDEITLRVDQNLKITETPSFKVIPNFKLTGHDIFTINPEEWVSNEGLAYAKKDIPFVSHNNWDCKGHAIRLIRVEFIPEGMNHITITDNSIEFSTNPAKFDITKPVQIRLNRYAFMHDTIRDYGIEDFNLNETIGQAKANII